MGGESLPESCVAHIISLTSPIEASRLAAVSSSWRRAEVSDTTWERFLPANYNEILTRADYPLKYSRKRELFFLLCNSILIDGGRKMFSLKRSNGAVCLFLSPMELNIYMEDVIVDQGTFFSTSGSSSELWSMMGMGGDPPESFPFKKVALLRNFLSIRISGTISSMMLTPKKYYSVRLVFRLSADAFGLHIPFKAEITQGSVAWDQRTFLYHHMLEWWRRITESSSMVIGFVRRRDDPELQKEKSIGENGWAEVEIGRFFCGQDGEVVFSVAGATSKPKSALLLQGIRLFPLN